MTIEEARKKLIDMQVEMCSYYCTGKPIQYPNCDFCEEREALMMADRALEKAQPAQPLDVQTPVITWGICPSCKGLPMLLGSPRRIMQIEKYCSNCGQRIDWSGAE